MTTVPKFVQIAVAPMQHDGPDLFALSEDGSVWQFNPRQKVWRKLPTDMAPSMDGATVAR